MLAELIFCIVGPIFGIIMFIVSPMFINWCEQEAGR